MNIRSTINKLQKALIQRGYIYKINTYQFYSAQQNRMIIGYRIKFQEEHMYLSKKQRWALGIALDAMERLSVEEMEACREAVKNDREKALLELMFSTGMRVGEISKLKIEDVNLDKRRIYIPDGKSDTSERYVYLTIKARNALKRYIGERKNGYVFRPSRKTLPDDKPLGKGSIDKMAKEIGKRAQVHCDATVHIYRKTFASEEYRRTGSVKYVSILLGHASTAITEKYYLVDDLKDVEYQALRAV